MTNQSVKAIARERLLGNYAKAVSALLTYVALRFLANSVITAIFNPTSIVALILNVLASFVVELVSGILVAGLAFFFLKLIYGQETAGNDIFHAFKEQPDKAVLLMLVISLSSQLWGVPLTVWLLSPYGSGTSMVFLAVTVIGFLLYAFVWLTYSQSFYLLQDFPDKTAKELLQMSRELMRGNKGRLAALVCSFFPLFLIGVVALFVPLLWVSVYLQASLASFYKELMEERRHG